MAGHKKSQLWKQVWYEKTKVTLLLDKNCGKVVLCGKALSWPQEHTHMEWAKIYHITSCFVQLKVFVATISQVAEPLSGSAK